MSAGFSILIVLALGLAGYVAGRRRAMAKAGGDSRRLHSLPGFYGQSALLFTAVPALSVILVWLVLQPIWIERRVQTFIEPSDIGEGSSLGLVMADVRRIARGIDTAVDRGRLTEDQVGALAAGAGEADTLLADTLLADVGVALGSAVKPHVLDAARSYRTETYRLSIAMTVAAVIVALGGLGWSLSRIETDFRARNVSERFVIGLMILASLVAVATTFGIVLSLAFETLQFFRIYPASDFFFSTVWNPQFRGGSDLGVLPLIWGTLYVSVIALLVAVPVGLLSAIYLSDYAAPPVRSVVKPLIEVLAGIPTIVYGLFALITVGPILRDYFAQPLGLGNSSSSVMTAGLVMGIMVIPFVSSLSDDIINAVPQSLRDGSLALGATPSETIRQVVLPAALPGVVGAILLAASRAIGETMIVVMGAGAAAKLSLNPFEAMTTVTVKIVSQLTGDTEFASPETLVAFALGLTLFVFTLGLNILALIIVRKYREQYE
ncbi:MAG: phosphate ABC transporter permease subunit PstC [Pseudomonadota bacterium]